MNLTAGVAEIITRRIRQEVAAHGAYRAIVTAVLGSGMVQIKLPGTSTTGGEAFARVSGLKLIANDEVLVLPVRGVPVVLGLLQRSSPTSLSFDEPLVAEQGINSPAIMPTYVQGAPTDSSNNSTSTYDTNVTTNWALPTGTWHVFAFGDGAYEIDSAGTYMSQRMVIDGNNGDSHGWQPPSTSQAGSLAMHDKENCSGTITLEIEYKPNTGGRTITADGGKIWAMAWRTA